MWWTVTEDQLDAARINPEILGGALHAAEHASIGMLPLFATCDRWDIGGVSVPLHPDTLLPTVFVYDGHPGGAGFAERAFHTARDWLTATRQAIASCECEAGCPSCIQSPKCGNGNEPLHKRGAVRLLTVLSAGGPAGEARGTEPVARDSGGTDPGGACGGGAVLRPRRPRPCPDLRRERAPSRRRRHVRDLADDRAPHQPRALGPATRAARAQAAVAAVRPVVGRRQRREVRTAGRTVPDHDGLPQGEHHAEHHAQHGDRTDAPDGGGPTVAGPGRRAHGAPGTRPWPRPHGSAPTVSSANATASARTSKGRPCRHRRLRRDRPPGPDPPPGRP